MRTKQVQNEKALDSTKKKPRLAGGAFRVLCLGSG
jgi:hypothetical protein